MITRSLDNISWLEFPYLQAFPQIRHACFTKSLGILPPFDSKNKLAKIERAFAAKGGLLDLMSMDQEHGTNIQFIEDGYDEQLPCDAIATNLVNKVLLVQHADCQPCILFDPLLNVIAVVHSGWRGSVKNIYNTTVTALTKRYGCDPKNLIACIGPSLGPKHAQFMHYEQELPPSFWSHKIEKDLFNFWAISQEQLLACGLAEEHIEIAQICTYEREDLFFSYRRDKTPMRNATCISLKS
jgi:polyphenol oxidase